jgi:hypothetical protein
MGQRRCLTNMRRRDTMETDNTAEFRSHSDAETAAELEHQIRTALPAASDADVADKAAALKAAGAIGWSVPQAAGETSELLIAQKGKVRSIADALADLGTEPPAPTAPPKQVIPPTADFMANRHAERNAAAAPLADPAPGVPDDKLTAEQYVQRQRYKRSIGERTRK